MGLKRICIDFISFLFLLCTRAEKSERYVEAGEEVNRMFDKSMREAHTGFRVALFMDAVVFTVGGARVPLHFICFFVFIFVQPCVQCRNFTES